MASAWRWPSLLVAFLLGNLNAYVLLTVFPSEWTSLKAFTLAEPAPDLYFSLRSTRAALQELEIQRKPNVSTEMEGLQVDIFGLPFNFLNSSQEVSAMMETWMSEFGMRLLEGLSHHFAPAGFSSVSLLAAGHAAVHTWPTLGYAAIDLITHGNKDLLNATFLLKDMVDKLSFGEAEFRFSFTVRGKGGVAIEGDESESLMLAEIRTEKIPVVRTASKYQRIDVWDVFGKSWVDGEHVHASRRLYLDGDLQLDTDDEYLYHEMMIHPAMLAHGHPERVCILGGGDLAALYNVLMHSSVQSAILVEIDELVISTAKATLDYRDAASDPRAIILIQDAFVWLASYSLHHAGSLDMLFFDLIDPTLPSPLLDTLFAGSQLENFVRQVKKVLRQDGAAVFQVGEYRFNRRCGGLGGGGATTKCVGNRGQNLFVHWLNATFRHVQIYTQYVPSFRGMWTFAVATDHASLFTERWGRPAAELDAEISARILQSDTLRYISGPTLARQGFTALIEATHVDVFQPRDQAERRPWKAETCEHVIPIRPNSPFKGYQVPYRVAQSEHANGHGVFTLSRIRRGETVWKFFNDSFIELTPENWLAVVEAQEFAKEKGVDAFLAMGWILGWPSEVGVKMFLQLDDGRSHNHGHTTSREADYKLIAGSPRASEDWAEYRWGKAMIALRDIEPCEELLEDYTSSYSLYEDGIYDTPEWWQKALESRGFVTDAHRWWPPSRTRYLPPYAWTNARANIE